MPPSLPSIAPAPHAPTWSDAARFRPTLDSARTFAEHEALKSILRAGDTHFELQTVCEVQAGSTDDPVHFPVFVASLGSTDLRAPAVGFFGGIHGLERIGTEVILHYMRALLFRLAWDTLLQKQLEKVRLVFMPIANPAACGRTSAATHKAST